MVLLVRTDKQSCGKRFKTLVLGYLGCLCEAELETFLASLLLMTSDNLEEFSEVVTLVNNER